MKTLLLIIAASAILFFHPGIKAEAKCMLDYDWPGKPCIDTYPPLPLTKSEWKELWSEYYDYKGQGWMEQKKLELVDQIKTGTLKQWIESGSDLHNFTNYNVWFYYYVNNQSPAPEGYDIAETPSPESAAYPTLGKEFKLVKGEVAYFKQEVIEIKFSNVTEDSRCPADVVCIWAGRVSVVVNVVKDTQDLGDYTLTLGENESNAMKTFDGYYVKLLAVEPPSLSKHQIQPDEYTATLIVAKTKDNAILSPLKQIKSGIPADLVKCRQGLLWVIKSTDGSPACVLPLTFNKLIERGWAKFQGSQTTSYVFANGTRYEIPYHLTGWRNNILNMTADLNSNSLIVDLQTKNKGELTLTIPKILLDTISPEQDPVFFVLVDGEESKAKNEKITDLDSTLTISFPEGTTKIEIIGTKLI